MQPDILDLQEFYQSRQGRWARWNISRQLRELWPDVRDMRLLGLGYATPYLGEFSECELYVAMMPAWQGASRWPRNGANSTFMSRDDELPLADRSVDRILIVHSLECTRNPARLLREAWRVLADGGRLIAVVPNRTGLWALSEATPFGTGRPYSMTQLEVTLRSNLFATLSEARALYFPPVDSRMMMRLAVPAEKIGAALLPQLSGAIIVEAEKQIYAGTPASVSRRSRARRYLPIPQGVAARDRRDPQSSRRDRN
jgi:SAM-dependent methyltransferase